MSKRSRNPHETRPLGSGTSKASKLTERRDALRILVALVFILLAATTGLEKGSTVDLAGGPADSAVSSASNNSNQQSLSWARLLLEALHRIV